MAAERIPWTATRVGFQDGLWGVEDVGWSCDCDCDCDCDCRGGGGGEGGGRGFLALEELACPGVGEFAWFAWFGGASEPILSQNPSQTILHHPPSTTGGQLPFQISIPMERPIKGLAPWDSWIKSNFDSCLGWDDLQSTNSAIYHLNLLDTALFRTRVLAQRQLVQSLRPTSISQSSIIDRVDKIGERIESRRRDFLPSSSLDGMTTTTTTTTTSDSIPSFRLPLLAASKQSQNLVKISKIRNQHFSTILEPNLEPLQNHLQTLSSGLDRILTDYVLLNNQIITLDAVTVTNLLMKSHSNESSIQKHKRAMNRRYQWLNELVAKTVERSVVPMMWFAWLVVMFVEGVRLVFGTGYRLLRWFFWVD